MENRCGKGSRCGVSSELQSAFSSSDSVSCRSGRVRVRTRSLGTGRMPRPHGSPCNGQHVPIYQTWSAAAWMCRLIPCAPTGGALPCGPAAWLCLIPPSARVCCCSSREARAPHRQDHRRRQRHGAACRRVQASMGCGELRPPGHRAEQPDPLLTGPRPTRNGAARPSTHRRRIRGDRARQCGVHRKLPRGNGRADEISVGHGYGGRVEQIRQALSPNDGLVAYGASHGSQYGQA